MFRMLASPFVRTHLPQQRSILGVGEHPRNQPAWRAELQWGGEEYRSIPDPR